MASSKRARRLAREKFERQQQRRAARQARRQRTWLMVVVAVLAVVVAVVAVWLLTRGGGEPTTQPKPDNPGTLAPAASPYPILGHMTLPPTMFPSTDSGYS